MTAVINGRLHDADPDVRLLLRRAADAAELAARLYDGAERGLARTAGYPASIISHAYATGIPVGRGAYPGRTDGARPARPRRSARAVAAVARGVLADVRGHVGRGYRAVGRAAVSDWTHMALLVGVALATALLILMR